MATQVSGGVDTDFLRAFAAAFNRHDMDGIMGFMADDGVFESSSGPEVNGARYEGKAQVRAGFAAVFDMFPDANWGNDTHFVCGDRGVSQWTFKGTRNDGSPVEVDGCDIFTFEGGKIAVKNSFRKNRTAS